MSNRRREPRTHDLKTWNPVFEAMERDDKPFDVRRADRDFRIGDTLLLREYNPYAQGDPSGGYSGRQTKREITYVLSGGKAGIESGYCVLGLRPTEEAATPNG